MRQKKKLVKMFLVVSVWLLTIVGCKVTDTVTPTPPPSATTPADLFSTSGHADGSAEAWIHWNGDNPPVVPTGCAKCHTAGGYLDYLDNGVVNAAAAPGILTCNV